MKFLDDEKADRLCFAGSRMRNLSSAGTFFGDSSRYWNWFFSHQVVITGACNNRSSKLPLKVLWKKQLIFSFYDAVLEILIP